MNERRKYKIIELDAKLMVKRLDDGNNEEVIIEVYDISTGGIGFFCKRPLQIGSVYEAYLTLWTKEVIHSFIEIVRITKVENTFSYGGTFIGMPEMDQKRIEIYDTFQSELEKSE